jgi:hypothetical protein
LSLGFEEAKDPKFGFTYKPSNVLTPGKDGDAEVMRVALESRRDPCADTNENPNEEIVVDDGLNAADVLEREA